MSQENQNKYLSKFCRQITRTKEYNWAINLTHQFGTLGRYLDLFCFTLHLNLSFYLIITIVIYYKFNLKKLNMSNQKNPLGCLFLSYIILIIVAFV